MIPKELSDKLSVEALHALNIWLTAEEYAPYQEEINELITTHNFVELEDRFYRHVKIGTGGIRGKVGAGPNRINVRTISEAAQGLANFIDDFGQEAKDKGVVVSHEIRLLSREFAETTCSVLAANGIKTFLFDGIRSTPEVSFAVRHLKAVAGVQLTASHNRKTDNGFKFFWTDGGQVVPPLDQKFMGLVLGVSKIIKMDFKEAESQGLVKTIGKEVDKVYLQNLKNLSLVKTRSAKIAFSPMHSSGITNALPALQEEGFSVTVVPEQAQPDENFPTAVDDTTNPEFEKVMGMVIALGEKIEADLAMSTDPDACRVGVAVRKKLNDPKLHYITANEVGVAILYFLLSILKERGEVDKNLLFIKIFCTTTLMTDIAEDFGIKHVDDLFVGFKWIGQIVEKMEDKSKFLLALEDTCGYARGDFIRDKDGAIGALTVAEMVSWLKDQGKTVPDFLNEIYEKYGYFRNVLYQVDVDGKEGFEDIVKLYKSFRADPPTELGGLKVVKIIDRLPKENRKPENYKAGVNGDEITFILSEDERIRMITRPSGTQPQFKYYVQVFGKVNGNLLEVKKEVDTLALKIEDSFYAYQDKVLGKEARGIKIISHWD